jgi:hypothetical protein
VEETSYIGSAAAAVVYLVVGARLLRLSFRDGLAPERLLGFTCLVWSLSYVLWVIPLAVPGGRNLESQFFTVSEIATDLGDISVAFFPFMAFRRGSTWAKWLVAAITACVIGGTAGSIWVGDPEVANPLTNAWWWLGWIGVVASAIWIGAEGLHHYGTSRRRVRLGLCEPIVSHRYLLWGLAGVFWAILDFVYVGQSIEFWVAGSWSAVLDNCVGFLEIVALAMIWLAYFAPAAYQRKINASAVLA